MKEERRVLEYASDGLNGKVGCLGNPRGLERFNTSARGSILNGEAQVLELVADGICQIPVLGGTGLGTGLENLGSSLVHVVARVGDQAGGNAQQTQRQLDLGLRKLNTKRVEQLDQRISGGQGSGLVAASPACSRYWLHSVTKPKTAPMAPAVLKSSSMHSLKAARVSALGGKRLRCCLIGIGRRMVRGPAQVLDRTGDTRKRVLGTLQALPRKIERRAIARLQHQQAQGGSGVLLEDLGQRKEVAERLGHLLAVYQQHARVHPGVGEAWCQAQVA